MKVNQLHRWDVSPKEAIAIQNNLKAKIIPQNAPELGNLNRVAGADVSYDKKTNLVHAVVVILSFPEFRLLEEKHITSEATFPYIPGLLVFREGPALIKAFEEISQEPQLIIFDGQGIAHPRGIGIATHLGILLDKPSIGCAKTILVGHCEEPENRKGAHSPLTKDGIRLGAALRTREGVEPVYISIGHKIDLPTSLKIILKCTQGYRLPEPIRQAHSLSNKLRTASSKEGELKLF